MARQNIELGSVPSGTGGDTPRSANMKVNGMTTEIYSLLAKLGTASNANLGQSSGQALSVPGLGLGTRAEVGNTSIYNSMNVWETSFGVIADATNFRPMNYGVMLNLAFPGTAYLGGQLWMGTAPGKIIGFRSGDYSNESFNTIYHTGNTTRAADGTLKAI